MLSKEDAYKILGEAREHGKKFIDPTFGDETWRRPEELQFDGERQMKGIELNRRDSWTIFRGGPGLTDASNLGHAWLTSTALALGSIEKMFVESDESVGCHILKVAVPEGMRYVVLDERFPTLGDGRESALKFRYAAAKKRQLWLPLVEKAIAKARGSYDALTERPVTTSHALTALTGLPVETLSWGDAASFDQKDVVRFLDKASTQVFLTGGTPDVGIIPGHAYAVLHHDDKEIAIGDHKTGTPRTLSLKDAGTAFKAIHSLAWSDDWTPTSATDATLADDVFLVTVSQTTSVVLDLAVTGYNSALTAALVIKAGDKEAFSDDGGSHWTLLHGNETVRAAAGASVPTTRRSSKTEPPSRHVTMKCNLVHENEKKPTVYIVAPVVVVTEASFTERMRLTVRSPKGSKKASVGTVQASPSTHRIAAHFWARHEAKAAGLAKGNATVFLKNDDTGRFFLLAENNEAQKSLRVRISFDTLVGCDLSRFDHGPESKKTKSLEKKPSLLKRMSSRKSSSSRSPSKKDILGLSTPESSPEKKEDDKPSGLLKRMGSRKSPSKKDIGLPSVDVEKLEHHPRLLQRMSSRKSPSKKDVDDVEKKEDEGPPIVVSTIPPKSAALVCVAVPQAFATRYSYATSKQLAFIDDDALTKLKPFDPPLSDDDLHTPQPLPALLSSSDLPKTQPKFFF